MDAGADAVMYHQFHHAQGVVSVWKEVGSLYLCSMLLQQVEVVLGVLEAANCSQRRLSGVLSTSAAW